MKRVVLAALAVAVGLTSCSTDEGARPAAPTDWTAVVGLEKVASLDQPLVFASHPAAPSPVYIGEKTGRVRALNVAADGSVTVRADVALDISDRISSGGEQGLLGIAFGPDGNNLYVNYTNTDGDTRVVEYPFADGRADADRERVLLAVDQPFANHNGGHLVFGPDKMLYIGLGDGGAGGDPNGNAQNLDTLLGKILRIEPTRAGYRAPRDNPFIGRAGARAEIWHYGLRNPWRFSFDRKGGDLWIADVGQDEFEEINHVAGDKGGLNFGWNRREGKHKFLGRAPDDVIDPQLEFSHKDGNCSITGGFVYRGDAIKALQGKYIFGDYCKGDLIAASGESVVDLGANVANLVAFGEDADGELWALALDGAVYRLVPA